MRYMLKSPAPDVPERYYIYGARVQRYLANKNMVQHPLYPQVKGALLRGIRSGEYVIYDPALNKLCLVPATFGETHDQVLAEQENLQEANDTG